MKKTLLILLLISSLGEVYAQDYDQLIAQIEQAATFDEMPVITVTAARDHNYLLRAKKFNDIHQVRAGDAYTLYFPLEIDKSRGTWETIWYSYNYICLAPTMDVDSPIITSIVSLDLNADDRTLYHKWLLKYEKIGRAKHAELEREKAKEERYITNSNIHVVLKDGVPIKAYQAVEDCIHWVSKHNEFHYQTIRWYCYNDDRLWIPNNHIILDDYMHPEPLTDKHLASKDIHLVMIRNFNHLADRAYNSKQEANKYTENQHKEYTIPLLYRTQESYNQIRIVKEKRLK